MLTAQVYWKRLRLIPYARSVHFIEDKMRKAWLCQATDCRKTYQILRSILKVLGPSLSFTPLIRFAHGVNASKGWWGVGVSPVGEVARHAGGVDRQKSPATPHGSAV